jgi:hypothetical protein
MHRRSLRRYVPRPCKHCDIRQSCQTGTGSQVFALSVLNTAEHEGPSAPDACVAIRTLHQQKLRSRTQGWTCRYMHSAPYAPQQQTHHHLAESSRTVVSLHLQKAVCRRIVRSKALCCICSLPMVLLSLCHPSQSLCSRPPTGLQKLVSLTTLLLARTSDSVAVVHYACPRKPPSNCSGV